MLDVVRITLGDDAMEGRNNVYLLDPDGGPATLIDAGAREHREDLEAGLANHGLALEEIDQVLVTHWHPDHAGLAGEIQSASDATVRAHPDDAALIEQDPDAWTRMEEQRAARFDQWAIPDGPRTELERFFETHDEYGGLAPTVDPIEADDRLDIGDAALEVLALPGHTSGLVGFGLDRTDPELFSGDALLPVYTPNIGGADVRVTHPLEVYLETLERIIDGGFHTCWPGHREPLSDPADRAREIARHHHERMLNVIDILETVGTTDTWTVSARLFGELEGIHVLHGPGEAHAHLDHLASRGIVDRDGRSYALSTSNPDLTGIFPETVLA
jgi:hydroxyacylglutathione hydrolase